MQVIAIHVVTANFLGDVFHVLAVQLRDKPIVGARHAVIPCA